MLDNTSKKRIDNCIDISDINIYKLKQERINNKIYYNLILKY